MLESVGDNAKRAATRAASFVTTYDLTGAMLTTPVTLYSEWNTRRVSTALKEGNTLMAVIQIIEAIFAYTILALPTFAGCVVKAFDYPRLVKENEHCKINLPVIGAGLKYAEAFRTSMSHDVSMKGREMHVEQRFALTKENFDIQCPLVENAIDEMTDFFHQVYFKAEGALAAQAKAPTTASASKKDDEKSTKTKSTSATTAVVAEKTEIDPKLGAINVELRRLIP